MGEPSVMGDPELDDNFWALEVFQATPAGNHAIPRDHYTIPKVSILSMVPPS